MIIRTLSDTLYASLATLTASRCLRLVQRVPDKNGFEAWMELVAENAPSTAGRPFAMLQAVVQPGMGDVLARFEEQWKPWEHQGDTYEELAESKLDDDAVVSVVTREAPPELRENLPFESEPNQLGTIIQPYPNSNKTLAMGDFRNNVNTESPDSGAGPLTVDHISVAGRSKGKDGKSDRQATDKTCSTCGK